VSALLDRIGERASKEKGEQFTNLLSHIKVPLLRRAFTRLRKDAAAGVDRETWSSYSKDLEARLLDLQDRVQRGAYHPPPVRRVYIPKGDGQTRPLGIPTVEDKLLQEAVRMLLQPIYESDFVGFSYGFRPGRSQHMALDALYVALHRKVNWVLDADIRSFFDTIDPEWLKRFVEHRIGDRRLVRLLMKWLHAGVVEAGELHEVQRGTPQGGTITPPTQVQTSNGAAAFPERRCELEHPTNAEDRDDRGDAAWILCRFLDSFGPALQGRVPDASVAAHSGRVRALPALDAASAQRV
jgi:hypothetical protein